MGSAGETLLKIGQLAEAVGESVPTIRHWMKSGLLPPAQVTPAGYHLFTSESVERCRRIQPLKGRRLTLAEIRDTIDAPAGVSTSGGAGGCGDEGTASPALGH